MASILFIHENFPAQFGGLAQYLAGLGWRVVFATAAEHVPADRKDHRMLPGVHVVRYTRARDPAETTHPYLRGTEKAVLNAQAFTRIGAALSKGGFTPDIVVAHSGWGSGSLARVVWPKARFVQYLEWWYNDQGVDWEPGYPRLNREDKAARTLCRNLPFLLDAQSADAIWVPTRFQADQLPDLLQPRVTVLHDGVDAGFYRPVQDGDRAFSHEGLPADAPIVTYATRGMEPMRGFPQFMAAWAQLQQVRRDLHCVIAGTDRTCYGAQPAGKLTYKQQLLKTYSFDPARLHFTGFLSKPNYRALLQRSRAHVYLTRPFVLSWSLIEAMMTGAPIVASDTAPVREAAPDSTVAYADFDDPSQIAARVTHLLTDDVAARRQQNAARAHAESTYASARLHPRLAEFLSQTMRLAD